MSNTKIPYADKTWNPIVGCPYPLVSEGCNNCWARELHNRRNKAKLAGKNLPVMYNFCFEDIQYFSERLEEPIKWRIPSRIFVCSQTDIFHKAVSDSFIDIMFKIMSNKKCKNHKFFLLTKRPENAVQYLNSRMMIIPDNVWIGATVCTISEFEHINSNMCMIYCKNKWISFEPFIDNSSVPDFNLEQYKWVVVGAESGNNARYCGTRQILSLIKSAKKYNARCFVKQIHIAHKNSFRVSKYPLEWPSELRIRELP